MPTIMTKISSPGSQYSTSASPSVPHPTPATEALESAIIDAPLPMDFSAITGLLGPIQDMLNESATEAMYPSPPINTPEVTSPTPSLSRYTVSRSRGFSAIGDRLAQLKFDDRRFAQRETDAASSNHSFEPSVAEDEESERASISEMFSDTGKCKQHTMHTTSHTLLASTPSDDAVPISLGSPAANPRIEEYLSFTSNDLPTKPTASSSHYPITFKDFHTNKSNFEPNSDCNSLKSDGGVTEKNNWAEEVEDAVVRACMRMEQLAKDEHTTNPSKTIEDYYVDRLKRLLGDRRRAHPVEIHIITKSTLY